MTTGNFKIWLVDADRASLALVREVAATALPNAVVHSGSSRETFREFPQDEIPDLIVLDGSPRTSNPLAPCTWLKGHARLRTVPVAVLVPFLGESHQRMAALEAGASAFLFLPLDAAQIVALLRQQTAEKERARLQSQLAQSKKMEVVGHLAGSVAHDYNNKLSIILGNAEIALNQVGPTHAIYGELVEIHEATLRACGLTQQLLAFARQQTVVPKILDLNKVVEGMIEILRGVVGNKISLVWRPCAELCRAKIDPTQVDQILANLVANARDAIEESGEITIATGMGTVAAADRANFPEVEPGEFVCLSVRDTGTGFDGENLERLFEPFFTAKGKGSGTGLGLATVDGIVKQNKGCIQVSSKPGVGSTFTVFLPRYQGAVEQANRIAPALPAETGAETILLVEDEVAMLKSTRRLLGQLGYRVLAASSPSEAIRLAQDHTMQAGKDVGNQSGKIDLLLTDVLLPEMDGRELANEMVKLIPDLKLLFMSGYPANIISHQGVVEDGVNFLAKPFTSKELAAKVRKAIARRAGESSGPVGL